MKNRHSIKRTLFIIYLAIILSLFIGNLFPYLSYKRYNEVLNDVNDRVYKIKDLVETNSKIDNALSNFASSEDTIYIDQIYNNYQDLNLLIGEFKEKVYDRTSYLYLENIEFILGNDYSNALESTIWSIRGVNEEDIQVNYYEYKRLNQYVNIYLDKLFEKELDYSREIQNNLKSVSKQINLRIFTFLIFNLLLILFFGVSYGKRLLGNIRKLTEVSKEVSKGNFDVEKIELHSNDETEVLADAFNTLISNTKRLISKIKENADFEVMLHKEEAEKSKIEVLLNQAKLKGLQAQINPHFLFNTLNVVAKTAILEDADETCELIESVADMFRYNLNNINKIITIQEEIQNIENYIFIQKARFGDRVDFLINIENEVLTYLIPFLTLQPIVENAFMHGIEDMESGGIIKVYSKEIDNEMYLIVEDNGKGMSNESIQELLNDGEIKSQSTGIGMSNVKKRLEFYYGIKEAIRIESKENTGTKVYIKVLRKFEVEDV